MNKLFNTKDGDWQLNACINWLHGGTDDKWGRYADGYLEAAKNLVEQVRNNRFSADILVYPIVFCYRHYIELRLKELIIKGRLLCEIPEELKLNHNIVKLWSECRDVLMRVWPEGPNKDLDSIELRILEFDKEDPTSYTFRYPINKAGQDTIPDEVHINLGQLFDEMEVVVELLDGASCGISEYLSQRASMQSDFGP